MYSFTLQNERVVRVESMVWAFGGKIATISWNMPSKQLSRRQIEYFVKGNACNGIFFIVTIFVK